MDEAGQSVAFSLSVGDPSLFAVQPAIAPDGTLTFTPAADISGSTFVDLVLTDDGGTANGGVDTSAGSSLSITVTDVNDMPSFTPGGNISVAEDSGPFSTPWATAISPGPPAEAGQAVSFSVVGNSNPGLLAAGPSIAPDGTLMFTPAADKFGSATIDLKMSDDGGIANGGVDSAAPASFRIDVINSNDASTANPDPDTDDDPLDFEVVKVSSLFIPAAVLVDNDTDPDGDPLTLVASPPSGTGIGTASCDATGCTYTPDGLSTGTDTFTYTITDGSLTDSAAITVTVVDYALSAFEGRLVINEILYNERSGEDDEFIEIYNDTGAPLNLTGFRLTDGNPIEDMETVLPIDLVFPASDGHFFLRLCNRAVTRSNSAILSRRGREWRLHRPDLERCRRQPQRLLGGVGHRSRRGPAGVCR